MKREDASARLRDLAAKGMTRQQAASELGIHYITVVRLAGREQIEFVHGNRVNSVRTGDPRAQTMATLYRAGYTLQQIGDQYGITRERVRQIMTKRLGVSAQDGGQAKVAKDKAARRSAARDARCLKKFGCTWDQYCEIRDYGRTRSASTGIPSKDPRQAFANQKRAAAHRGIEWQLTLFQWWCIWKNSGHWDHRGRGQGYVMCRFGDVGPYSPENVFIDLCLNNSSAGSKKSELPIGVIKVKKCRGYTAQRMINGVKHRIGTFPTPELAHAAYLAFGEKHSEAA